MLHIVLWKWTQPGFREVYTAAHVNAMVDMIRKHQSGMSEMRIILVTDDARGVVSGVHIHPLWEDGNTLKNKSGDHLPSCYRRLRLFDQVTQAQMGIKAGDRIASIDLDAVITGDLKPILERKARFLGWRVRGTKHLSVFNGSFFMFTAGDFKEIWTEFDPDKSPEIAHKAGYFGSDQSWLSYKLARRTDCEGFAYPQMLSYPREVARRPILPKGAIIVFFHGKRKPWHPIVQTESRWITKHWQQGSDVPVLANA